MSIPMDWGVAGYVAKTGEFLAIENAYRDPRYALTVVYS